jgi:hypothetical protein
MQFDNRITQIFHVEGKKQYRMKLIYQNGKPMLGYSIFYQNGAIWFPGRKHFFLPVDAWKAMMSNIIPFTQQAIKGSRQTCLNSFLLTLYYVTKNIMTNFILSLLRIFRRRRGE